MGFVTRASSHATKAGRRRGISQMILTVLVSGDVVSMLGVILRKHAYAEIAAYGGLRQTAWPSCG